MSIYGKPIVNSSPSKLVLGLFSATLLLSSCQTFKQSTQSVPTHTVPATSNTNTTNPLLDATQPVRLAQFTIRGKIGVISPATNQSSAQSGSAFYMWSQVDERFAIDIAGALGIGHTIIEYDGQTASLQAPNTEMVSADNPEALLLRATGWQAPISQLPYWISGHVAPSDHTYHLDERGRLQTSVNGQWNASFNYDDNSTSLLPQKIKIEQPNGYRVILTIEHETL